MSGETRYPALETAIEACADCIRLYKAAAEMVEDEPWRRFLLQMVLRRETLLHRLRFLADHPIEAQTTEDFVTLRGRFEEMALSLKGIFGDQIEAALGSLEAAETRLVDCLGMIGVAIADPHELAEIFEAVTSERDSLRDLLSSRSDETMDPVIDGRRPA